MEKSEPTSNNYTELTQEQLIAALLERDEEIVALEAAVTKHKCSELKQQQLVKSLQEKISRLTPNSADTASEFMMPSEFKQRFETLMTATLPNALGAFMYLPRMFAKCVEQIVVRVNSGVERRIKQIEEEVLAVLGMQSSNNGLIKSSLLKIMQENWQTIFSLDKSQCHFVDPSQVTSADALQQINEALQGQDCTQLMEQLHVICVYMQLQEKEWRWEGLNQPQTIEYTKKEHTCIDGWIKEQAPALMLLKGIKRDNHMHANLKNYVVPYEEDNEQLLSYSQLTLKQRQQIKTQQSQENQPILTQAPVIQISQINGHTSRSSLRQFEHEHNSTQPAAVIESITLLSKNRSIQHLISDKENMPPLQNKHPRHKKKVKNGESLEESLHFVQKSPKSKPLKRQEDGLHKKKKVNSSFEEKMMHIKEEAGTKKNTGGRKFNADALFEQCVAVAKLSKNEDLPVSKDFPLRKRTRPNTSRKNSVGKIVSQNSNHSQKENLHQLNGSTKLKAKEKLYKEMIKQKLLEERAGTAKIRTYRARKEQRPLKLHNNASKLREKYIY